MEGIIQYDQPSLKKKKKHYKWIKVKKKKKPWNEYKIFLRKYSV